MSSRYKSKYLVINNTAVANPVLDTVVDLLHFDIPCQNEGLFKYLKMITICILNLFDIHKNKYGYYSPNLYEVTLWGLHSIGIEP